MDRRGPLPRILTADRIAALVFLAVVALYGWGSTQFVAALQEDVVGPAFFPRILTVAGIALGILLLITPAPSAEGERETGAGHLTALAPVLLLLAYALTLEPLGFPIATAAFLAATFRYLGHPSWRGALAIAVGITATAFVLFHVVLEVRLPLGLVARLF
jgi:putative tricarboxylic transport membrane protein